MKKSYLSYLLVASLCLFSSIARAEMDEGYKSYRDQILGNTSTQTETSTTIETETDTGTYTETTTVTSTATATSTSTSTTASSTATVSDTQTQTQTDWSIYNNTESDTDTSVASSTNNPFDENQEVKDVVETEDPVSITDVETAKKCGIEEIAEGFPKDGSIASTGGSRLRLRSWPWGNVIGTYDEGTKLKVLGVSGEFYLVEIDGKQGYMHKSYITCGDDAASGKAPYYPGSTRSGGALSLEDGVQASKDGAEGKVPTTTGGTPGTVTITSEKVLLDVPKKNQYQANTPAPGSSCGPTSLAMCLGFFGKGDPSVLVTDLYSVCGCTADNGTGHAGLEAGAHKYGLTDAKFYYSVSQDWCRQQLEAGKPLICHVAHHYVVMKGMDSNGNVILNDPAYNGVERTMSWSDFSVWWNNSGLGHSAMTF